MNSASFNPSQFVPTGPPAIDDTLARALQTRWPQRHRRAAPSADDLVTLMNSTLVGISYNLERKVLWANDTYLEITGFGREELMRLGARLFYPSDAEFSRQADAIHAALAVHNTYECERQVRRPDGSTCWVMLAGRCVVPHCPSAGIIWTMVDITARRQAQEESRLAQARQEELSCLRARFVGMTSHELRTPLAAILSCAELLRNYDAHLSAAEKTESLQAIENAVLRMSGMLDRVLTIGKIDADMLVFDPKARDLDALCRHVVADLQLVHPESVGRIRYCCDPAAPLRVFDEVLLRHILDNLLSNALKYSPPSQLVDFSIRSANGWAVFEVTDRGIGIPEVEQTAIFDNYYRASNVGHLSGTGLGLAIVRRAVELHGGHIEVHSQSLESKAVGTRFVVRLPQSIS